ncbi:MAG: hypothetical protein HY527_12990 [Betaproteobacteria bacterium]|nr:hypothetical protein [Betaproteobacteria bacterium]
MAKALARSIKTRRDYHGATSVANKARQQSGQEPESERRLQALLREIEKFDETQNEDDDFADAAEDADSLPRRRWSDELSDRE